MNSLLELVLSLSLGGSLLALLVLGLKLTLRRRLPSAFYYCAWLLVLLRLALPLPGFISLGETSKSAPAEQVYTSPAAVPDARPRAVRVGELPTAINAGSESGSFTVSSPSGAEAENEAPAGPAASAPVPQSGVNLSLALSNVVKLLSGLDLWLCLWGLGATLTLIWYIAGYLRFDRALRRTLCRAGLFERGIYRELGGPERLRLRRSPAVSTPMLLGVLHPVLVLPDMEYTEDMLRNIFSHELTHYRRGDLICKWFAVLVSAVHWFNPIVHIARHELDRACEMSCDERLLRAMNRNDKQSYGETLLSLAAGNSLPRRLVATTFATEKRDLKERLEQIMTYKHMGRATLALIIAVALLLTGCAAAVGPQPSLEPVESPAPTVTPAPEVTEVPAPTPASVPQTELTVASVDELLAAIAPNTSITLLEGEYDLSTAADYGSSAPGSNYSWAPVFDPDGKDAFELIISGVSNLSLMAEGEVTISAVPRYANVLSFESCANICLAGLTIGHTEAPGQCRGGVVLLQSVDNTIISQCKLFGCGTVGVSAQDSTGLRVVESEIYDCSYSAAQLNGCQDVLFNNCKIYANEALTALFNIRSSDNCAVINSTISGNTSPQMLLAAYSPKLYFAGNTVEDNSFSASGMFWLEGEPISVEGCKFTNNNGEWYSTGYNGDALLQAVDAKGNTLDGSALAAMELKSVDSWAAALPEPPAVAAAEDGYIHVSTVDEFLAALAPGASIYLEDGEFDLRDASSYGGYGGEYYSWVDTNVDGPQLVIFGIDGLTISGGGADKASILATPRYAEVLAFKNCSNISLSGFTAGHTQSPGTCVGGVLYFASCQDISIDACSLFGCGVWGITINDCDGLDVKNTEIYDCSLGDLNFWASRNISLENCDIHDNGLARVVRECTNATIDGKALVSFAPPDFPELGLAMLDFTAAPKPGLYLRYSGLLVMPELPAPALAPMELTASYYDGTNWIELTDEDVNWTVSNAKLLSLNERKHGNCIIENLGGKTGSVTVTAEAKGYTLDINIDLVDTLTESGPTGRIVPELKLMCCDSELPEGEFTFKVGDPSLPLTAVLAPGTSGDITWECSSPEHLKISPDGADCTIEAIAAVEGGVTLTARCDYLALERSIKIYIVP